MITITKQIDINDFEAWSGAKVTLQTIRKANKLDELESYINSIFPDGCSDTELNDELWFNDDKIFEAIGIPVDDEDMSWSLDENLYENEPPMNYTEDCNTKDDSDAAWTISLSSSPNNFSDIEDDIYDTQAEAVAAAEELLKKSEEIYALIGLYIYSKDEYRFDKMYTLKLVDDKMVIKQINL